MNFLKDLMIVLADVGLWIISALFAGFGMIFVGMLIGYLRKQNRNWLTVFVCLMVALLGFAAFIGCAFGAIKIIESWW